MDLDKVLAQLREELANLDAAILSLERLQEVTGAGHRRRKARARPDMPEAAASEPGDQAGEPCESGEG